MYVSYDPDQYETVITHETCAFHKQHPGEDFAGCCCSAGYMQRPRDPEEYAAIKAKKRREEEDRIIAQAEVIKACRLQPQQNTDRDNPPDKERA